MPSKTKESLEIKDPFVAYVYDIQVKEQAIQQALENSKIKIGEQIYTLKDAIGVLAQSYGMTTPQSKARTQIALNVESLLEHFLEGISATTEQRNELIRKAHEISQQPTPKAESENPLEEAAWEAEILAKARAEREAAKNN